MSAPNPLSLLQTSPSTLIPPFPLWLYKYLAAFPVTGLLGLDHFALGSSMTGMLKLFVNMLTFGSWYAYDIVQVFHPENLRENGLQMPFLETGHIGKGRIDETPMEIMTKNTKIWILIIFIALFGALFACTTPFITTGTDAASSAIRWISILSFFITIILMIGTLGYYLGSKIMSLFTMLKGTKSPAASLKSLSSSSASSILSHPTSALTGTSQVSSILGTGAKTGVSAIPGLSLGGAMNELTSIANQVMEGGKRYESSSIDHIVFPLILLLIPISGFTIYTLRKSAKKNELPQP